MDGCHQLTSGLKTEWMLEMDAGHPSFVEWETVTGGKGPHGKGEAVEILRLKVRWKPKASEKTRWRYWRQAWRMYRMRWMRKAVPASGCVGSGPAEVAR